MAHTTTETPTGGWWAADLIAPNGESVTDPVGALLVLDRAFPAHDLAVDPNRLPEGLWLIELPAQAIEVLATQGFLEVGQEHLGLVRIEDEAR